MIAFVSNREERFSLFVTNADGSDTRAYIRDVDLGGRPTWSPDGRWIVYAGENARGSALYLLEVDGDRVIQLTEFGLGLCCPHWTASG